MKRQCPAGFCASTLRSTSSGREAKKSMPVRRSTSSTLIMNSLIRAPFLIAMWIDETDGTRRLRIRHEYHLEEGVGHHHPSGSDTLGRPSDDRATHYPNGTVTLRPFTTLPFQLSPVARIKSCLLRTHVGQVETLFHRIPVPTHVGSRNHVTTCISRMLVIGQRRLRTGKVRIFTKRVFTLHFRFCLVSRKFPSHPVGYLPFGIIRHHVAFMVQDVFVTTVQRCRQSKCLSCLHTRRRP